MLSVIRSLSFHFLFVNIVVQPFSVSSVLIVYGTTVFQPSLPITVPCLRLKFFFHPLVLIVPFQSPIDVVSRESKSSY